MNQQGGLKTVICANCKASLPDSARFCDQCGYGVSQVARHPNIPKEIAERAADFTGRAWVANEVANWIDSGSERFFLILGEPGSGKTSLAAWFAGAGVSSDATLERIRSSWNAIHFCVAADKRGSLNPGRFSQSLAKQFTDHYDGYAYAILARNAPTVNIHQHARELWGQMIGAQIGSLVIHSNFEDIYNRAVREPLEEIYASSPIHRTLVLVDALDEAFHFGPTNIVTLLAGSNDLPDGVRFLLTSRRDTDITRKFKSVRRIDLSGAENKSEANVDILTYVRARLADSRVASSIGAGVSVPKLETDLVERAAGNFMYVKFLLDEVAEGRRSLEDSHGLPRGLYSMYSGYLDRLVPNTAESFSSSWRKDYQPLLGCMSVALNAAPRQNLHRWMETKDENVNSLLTDVMQITEFEQDYGGSYRLYHRSMAEFLAKSQYQENGDIEINKYHTPPYDQHDRIIRSYTSPLPANWTDCDAYGLRQLINHIHVCRNLAEREADKERLAQLMFDIVLNDAFRRAQQEKLRDAQAGFEDLRTALDVALDSGNLIAAMRCVGAYRAAIHDSRIVDEIFQALDRQDYDEALNGAEHYGVTSLQGSWGTVLHLYIGWEAALAGNESSALTAARTASELPLGETGMFCDALRARIAYVLGDLPNASKGALEWMKEILQGQGDPEWTLSRYKTANALSQEESDEARKTLSELDSKLAETAKSIAAEWDPERRAQLVPDFFDSESAALDAQNVASVLAHFVSEQEGQQRIEQILRTVLNNPYPEYRDMALSAVGEALMIAPNTAFVREVLRRTLRVTLNSDGVTFTFELPCILLAEAESRGLPTSPLSDFIATAATTNDLWGSALRATSAIAASHFWQGRHDIALQEIERASRMTEGFSGFMTLHLLSIFNRLSEFGVSPSGGLLEEITQRAATVRDYEFRERRMKLVESFKLWLADDSTLTKPEVARETLAKLTDPDERRLFKEFVTARWVAAGSAYQEDIEKLLPTTLGHATTLDTVLGRIVGPRLKALSDEDLNAALRICAEQLSLAKPWELKPPRYA